MRRDKRKRTSKVPAVKPDYGLSLIPPSKEDDRAIISIIKYKGETPVETMSVYLDPTSRTELADWLFRIDNEEV